MKKITLLLLVSIALFSSCNGDTETSVLASPADTAKYDALGVALVAVGSTFDMELSGPVTVTDAGTAFRLRWEIGGNESIYDPTRSPDPYKGAWTDAEKARFATLIASVQLTR